MSRRQILLLAKTLPVNVVISWVLLPYAIPPFRAYTLSQLLEVLYWQLIGAIGWPFALLGVLISLPFGSTVRFPTVLMVLLYPSAILIALRVVTSSRFHLWQFILLHLVVTLTFVSVWYGVLNGSVFFPG